ncbi:MAG: methylated-DNA--[protein]-cysteine S-methyltransferase [Oscillospiraceae bacterium]|nr:methylated-DNA--[protein]-cysteine S-methyltransferase [Oscillospiraceae bacterium]
MGNTYYTYDSPFGKITIESDGNAVTSVKTQSHTDPTGEKKASTLTDIAAMQLDEYFAGKRKKFDIPINPHGTAFQLSVWKALQAIPYGKTRSYKQIAQAIGNPKACRAVGLANNKNPIWIIIPCHRVIGADGSLTGYGGGINMKKKLLEIEGRI